MSRNTIELIPVATVAPTIRTSYDARGKTRGDDGKLLRRESCVTVGESKMHGVWMTTPATARALAALHDDCEASGVDLRLTALRRDTAVQARERKAFDAWVAAGRPDPGTPQFIARSMRTTYVAKPGASFHGVGCAFDLDIGALSVRKVDSTSHTVTILTGNAALAEFWKIAAKHGFSPAISHPRASQSEAWHFDRVGVFAAVRALFEADRATAGDDYGLTAKVIHALAGCHPDSVTHQFLYVQARLLVGGFHKLPDGRILIPDGIVGKDTRAALKAAGCTHVGELAFGVIVAELDAKGIGLDVIAAA